jgi:NADPH:quinone reductase-like Zn-dependent oxidoreductase
MRAFAVAEPDAKPAVLDLPDPTPDPGEILVRVTSSSVNGFDLAVAAGMLAQMMEHRYPVVLGKDYAGVVQAVGDGVDRFAVGDRVFGVVSKPYLGDGGLGELVVVGDGHGVAPVPAGLPLATAGALGLAGTAAVDAVDALAPRAGQTVLVAGATGGVGSLVVQYAAAAGATVLATALPGAEADFVRELGAQHTLDYTKDLAAQARAVAPGGVDLVIHLAGDGAAMADLLTPDGALASTKGFGPDRHPRAVPVMATATPATLDRLAADVASGRIRLPVQATFDLHDVADAFAAFSAGSRGKIAVSIG